ncbi:hypothetical protein BC936DRAFT_144371, partial [Jimgerdemannia flammicorona]
MGITQACTIIAMFTKENVPENHIGDKETIAFEMNTSLRNLNLSGNGTGEEGASTLAEGPKMNTNLQTLDLDGNTIVKDGASELAEVPEMKTSLQNLNLERNTIGEKGASTLIEALKTNTILPTLNVKIENDLIAQAEALVMIRSLQNLDLL